MHKTDIKRPIYVFLVATAVITVLVRCYLSLGSFSWRSVSGQLSFSVVIELTIFIVSVL